MTANSLYYMPHDGLRHKIVFCAERKHVDVKNPEAANATLALREMISSGRLSKLIPIKNESGIFETYCIEREGPITYLETTTQERINDEDETRMLLLVTDETPAQTGRIMQQLAPRQAVHRLQLR